MVKKIFPVPMRDYYRIFRIVHSVSSSIGNIPGKACLFYNAVGAAMLETNFKKKARPVMGSACIRIHDESDTVLSYGHLDANTLSSDTEAFHCWIQFDDHVIDFTAPVYNESLRNVGCEHTIPRKMFQKGLTKMARSHLDLGKEGDFYFEPNIPLSKILTEKTFQTPAVGDLANICMLWYKKTPKKIPNKFLMQNDLGEETNIRLSNIKLAGSW